MSEDIIKHIDSQLQEEGISDKLRALLTQCKEHFEQPGRTSNIEDTTKLILALQAAMATGLQIYQIIAHT